MLIVLDVEQVDFAAFARHRCFHRRPAFRSFTPNCDKRGIPLPVSGRHDRSMRYPQKQHPEYLYRSDALAPGTNGSMPMVENQIVYR